MSWNSKWFTGEQDIGVIAPYHAQCQRIRQQLDAGSSEVKVGSVEEFQGQVSPETKLWQLGYLMKFDRNAKSSSFQQYEAVKSSCPMTFVTPLDSSPVRDASMVTIRLWPMAWDVLTWTPISLHYQGQSSPYYYRWSRCPWAGPSLEGIPQLHI